MTADIINNVITQGRLLASHSWEYGTLSEALLEWYNPEMSVFSKDAFPNGEIPILDVETTQSLSYAITNIRTNSTTLVDGDGKQAPMVPPSQAMRSTDRSSKKVPPPTQLLSGSQPSSSARHSPNIWQQRSVKSTTCLTLFRGQKTGPSATGNPTWSSGPTSSTWCRRPSHTGPYRPATSPCSTRPSSSETSTAKSWEFPSKALARGLWRMR